MKFPSTVFLFLLVVLAQPLMGQNVQQDYNGIREAFQRNEFSRVVSLVDSFLRSHPESNLLADVEYLQAVAHYQARNYSASQAVLRRFERRYPGSAYLQRLAYWQGANALALGNFQEAAREFQRQTQFPGETQFLTRSYLYLGASLERLDRIPEALEAYRQVSLASDRSLLPQALIRMGQILVDLGRPQEALEPLTRLMVDFSESSQVRDALFFLAEALKGVGRLEEARDRYRRYVMNYPRAPHRETALFRLASYHGDRREYEEGSEYLRLLNQEFPRGRYAHQSRQILVDHYLSQGRFEEAVPLMEALVREAESPALAQRLNFNLGTLLYRSQSWTGAATYFGAAATGPENTVALRSQFYQASALYQNNQEGAAAPLFESVLDSGADSQLKESSGQILAEYYRRNQMEAQEISVLGRLIENFPLSAQRENYLFQRGYSHLGQRNLVEALSDYVQLVREYPRSPLVAEALYQTAYVYTLRGEHLRAEGYYLQVTERLGPGEELHDRALIGRGLSFLNGRRLDLAVAAFQRLRRDNPESQHIGDSFYYEALAELRRDNPAGAAGLFNQSHGVLGAQGRGPEALYQAALAHGQGEDLESAAQGFMAYLELYPRGSRRDVSRLEAGRTLLALDRAQESWNLLERAGTLNTDRQSPEAQWLRIQNLWALENESEARREILDFRRRHRESAWYTEVLLAAAQRENQAARLSGAAEYYQMIWEDQPGTPQAELAGLRRGEQLLLAGEFSQAVDAYREFWTQVGFNQAKLPLLKTIINLIDAQSSPELVEEFYQALNTLDPGPPLSHELQLFYARYFADFRPEAESLLQNITVSATLADHQERSWLALAALYERTERREQAEEAYRNLLGIARGEALYRVYLGLGSLLENQAEIPRVLETYETALEQDGWAPEQESHLRYLYVRSLRNAENHSQAQRELRTLVRLFPGLYWTRKAQDELGDNS